MTKFDAKKCLQNFFKQDIEDVKELLSKEHRTNLVCDVKDFLLAGFLLYAPLAFLFLFQELHACQCKEICSVEGFKLSKQAQSSESIFSIFSNQCTCKFGGDYDKEFKRFVSTGEGWVELS